jgi:hypothetical protein
MKRTICDYLVLMARYSKELILPLPRISDPRDYIYLYPFARKWITISDTIQEFVALYYKPL